MKLMNHSKISAALHALADAFLADVEAVESGVTGGKKAVSGKKASQVEQTIVAEASAPVAVVEAAPVAPVSTVTIAQLNKAVLTVAAKNRDAAVAVLTKFGLANTVGLAPEKYQAVYDAFEEEIAKIDAAAVQVAQASLV
jgi:hypothetical protein